MAEQYIVRVKQDRPADPAMLSVCRVTSNGHFKEVDRYRRGTPMEMVSAAFGRAVELSGTGVQTRLEVNVALTALADSAC